MSFRFNPFTGKLDDIGNDDEATPGGADTNVQYNDGGSFGGSASFTFNNVTNTLTCNVGNFLTLSATNPNSLTLGSQGSTDGSIRFYNADTSGVVNIIASNFSKSVDYFLPLADGTSGQFLQTDGSGVMSWATPAGGGDVSKVGTPADNQVGVWTGDGTIEGTANLTYDGSNLQLTGDIGATGTRITKGWFTDLEVTNAIAGSITGNAGTVTNGIYTSSKLSDLSATTSLELAGVISDETGTGLLVFNNSPTFVDDITIGGAGVATGIIKLSGTTSGTVSLTVAAEAGTWTMTLPANDGDAGQVLTTNGSGVTSWAAAGSGANTALSNLSSVAINETLVSDTDNTDALGTAAISWSDLFLGNGSVITWSSAPSTADVTLTHSANLLTLGGGNLALGGGNISGAGTINGTIITATTQLISDASSDTAASCPLIDLRRSRDGDPTDSVADNDYLGEVRFRGYHTEGFYEGAIIRAVVNGTPGSGDMPAELIFATSADGSATPTTRLTIDAAGLATFAGGITAGGDLALGANNLTMTGSLGVTGARLTKGWFTDLEVTNAIAGSITGNAATATAAAAQAITDNAIVTVDDADAADNDYAKFTASGVEGRSYAEVLGDLSGQASAAFGFNSQNLTRVGTIGCDTITSTGNLVIADAGTIGSASDTDAISISSGGVVGLTQNVTIAAAKNLYFDGGGNTYMVSPSSDVFDIYVGGVKAISITESTTAPVTFSDSIIVPGDVGLTGTRVTKGWFTDLEVTNDITISGTALAATYSPIAGSASIVTTGALDTGSITSNFGAINNGASAITTTGTVSAGNITLGTDGTVSAMTLTEKASIALDPAGGADGDYSGITIAGTAGATLAFGDLVYLDPTDSRWELADANSASGADGDSRGILGMVVLSAASDGDPVTVLLQGVIRADTAFPALTINGAVYASEAAGDITNTCPTTSGVVVRVLGSAITADEIYFNPSPSWIIAV